MGYRKVYRTVDEQTTKKMVKMLQRHGIMAYGTVFGAAQEIPLFSPSRQSVFLPPLPVLPSHKQRVPDTVFPL